MAIEENDEMMIKYWTVGFRANHHEMEKPPEMGYGYTVIPSIFIGFSIINYPYLGTFIYGTPKILG